LMALGLISYNSAALFWVICFFSICSKVRSFNSFECPWFWSCFVLCGSGTGFCVTLFVITEDFWNFEIIPGSKRMMLLAKSILCRILVGLLMPILAFAYFNHCDIHPLLQFWEGACCQRLGEEAIYMCACVLACRSYWWRCLLMRHDKSSIYFLFTENDVIEALQSSSESEFILSNMRFDQRHGNNLSMYLFTNWFEIISYASLSKVSASWNGAVSTGICTKHSPLLLHHFPRKDGHLNPHQTHYQDPCLELVVRVSLL
jgi:hypothetical protein